MKFSVFSASILLGTTATAISLPNPPAHSYGGGDHAAAGKKRPCTQAEIALATGIHLNINGQYGEYNGTVQVEQVETDASTKSDTKAFDLAKGKLQSDIQAGMNIRLFNQQIAPSNNPAIPGLTQYASAQETEKSLAAGLTGDYTKDKAALDSLKKDIKQGIQLNHKNLKAATSECDFTLVFPPENEMGV